jgi:hypothetical protein
MRPQASANARKAAALRELCRPHVGQEGLTRRI